MMKFKVFFIILISLSYSECFFDSNFISSFPNFINGLFGFPSSFNNIKEWNDLKVTYSLNYSDPNGFVSMPKTVSEALLKGWTREKGHYLTLIFTLLH